MLPTRPVPTVRDTDGGWKVDWSEGNAPHAEATCGYEITEP